MGRPRPVIRRDGKRYLSAEAAGRALKLTSVAFAAKATAEGRVATAGGWQFAYEDARLSHWPEPKPKPKLKPKSEPKPKRFRALLRSDGCEFASIVEAARTCLVREAKLIAAAKATEEGIYKNVAGFQWAYSDQKPIFWPARMSYQGRSASVVRSDGMQFDNLQAAVLTVNCCTVREIGEAARATSRGEYMEAGGYQWAYSSFIPEIWPKKPETRQ